MKIFHLLLLVLVATILSCSAGPPDPPLDCPDNGVLAFVTTGINSSVELQHPNHIFQKLPYDAGDISMEKELIISVDNLDNEVNYFASLSPSNSLQEDLPPPESNIKELFTLPSKSDPWEKKFQWIIAAAAIILYNLLQKVRKTSKSWTILGMLYRFFNSVIKDKAKSGGNLEILQE